MANGISRRSVYDAFHGCSDRDGNFDLWRFAKELADDVESWGEDDFFSEQPSNADAGQAPPPRFWMVIPK